MTKLIGTSSASVLKGLSGWCCAGLGAAIALSTLGMVIVTHNPVPIYDQWDNLIASRPIDWAWLTAQHNEHRPLVARLIFWLDNLLSHETNTVDQTLSLLFVATTLALLAHLARRSGLLSPKPRALWALGLLLGFSFSAIQEENFTWGFQVQFFGVSTFAVASLMVLILARPTLAMLTSVIVLESIALYTLSSGIVVVILTIVAALWLGRPRHHLALLSMAAAVLLATYLTGYRTPLQHTDPLGSLTHLGAISLYALTELGLPVWFMLFLRDPATSAICGVCGLAVFARFAVKLWAGRKVAPHGTAWLAIATFALGVAVLTALGRSDFGAEQALSSRYATPMVLFWLALLMLAAMEVSRGARASRTAVSGVGFVMVVLLAANQPRTIHWAVQGDALARSAIPAILTGVGDTAMLERVYPSNAGVLNRIGALKQDHASVFAAPWADWLGQPRPATGASRDVPACPGSIEKVQAVDDPLHPGWHAVGHLHPGSMPDLSDRLVFLDPDERVIGYGLAGFSAKVLGEDPAQGRNDWWVGAIRAPTPATVTAYALKSDDELGCGFGPFTPGR